MRLISSGVRCICSTSMMCPRISSGNGGRLGDGVLVVPPSLGAGDDDDDGSGSNKGSCVA